MDGINVKVNGPSFKTGFTIEFYRVQSTRSVRDGQSLLYFLFFLLSPSGYFSNEKDGCEDSTAVWILFIGVYSNDFSFRGCFTQKIIKNTGFQPPKIPNMTMCTYEDKELKNMSVFI